MSEAKPRRRRPGLAGQVMIGLALGVATGLFFGELAASLKIIGRGAKSTQPRWSVIRDVLGWID